MALIEQRLGQSETSQVIEKMRNLYSARYPIDVGELTEKQLEAVMFPSLNDLPAVRPLLSRILGKISSICSRIPLCQNSLKLKQ